MNWHLRFKIQNKARYLVRKLTPYALRQRVAYWLEMRALLNEQSSYHAAAINKMKAHSFDIIQVESILEEFQLEVLPSIQDKIIRLENKRLLNRADKYGIEIDPNSLWDWSEEDDEELPTPNKTARRKLIRDVYEERWKRFERWLRVVVTVAGIIISILSLTVAIVALLTRK